MTIATYTDLQNAVANWISRADLAAQIADFITLFETTANRRLRARQMEATAAITMGAPSQALITETNEIIVTEAAVTGYDITAGAADLPADYLSWRRVTYIGASTRVELDYVHPSVLQSMYPTTPAGVPAKFTIENNTLKVRPTSDGDYVEFDYYQKIPVLSASNPTNWLLTAHPDLYLYGSLMEATAFDKEMENSAMWKARRDELFSELSTLSEKTKAPSSMLILGPTP